MIEEFVESFEHADPVKDVMHDIEPPEPFTLFDSRRFSRGKDRRRGFAERSTERLFDRDQRVWFRRKAEFNRMPQINLSDRPRHVKEGVGCIEKYYSYR
ncbi:MAG: hypothetical protein QM706_15715 [Nitrospira sp.]